MAKRFSSTFAPLEVKAVAAYETDRESLLS
ncbi:UNVERIFIED_CONTAM: hypothetical protein GTU68_034887 [Idotea baltica]|nr:hypothetical protein [Idotea baltica]